MDRRPALQPRLPRPPHRAAGAREPRAAPQRRRPRARAAARPHEAAVGDLARRRGRGRALRDDHQDPSLPGRRRLGGRHRHRPVRRRGRPDPRRSRRPPWFPKPEPSAATLVADALAERASTPLDALRLLADALAHPEKAAGAARQGRLRPRRDGARRPPGRAPEPLQRPDRAAPALRVGGRRPRAVQGDQGRAGRHCQRRRADRRDRRAAHPHGGQRPRGRRRRARRRWCRCRCARRPSAGRWATA